MFLLGLYAFAMLVGGIYSLVKLVRAPSTGSGAAVVAGAFAISSVIFVGLSGACFVGLGALQPR